MDVSFANARSKGLFASKAQLMQAYGELCAKKVMARLADLRAAPSLEEFRHLPGHCHELDDGRTGQLSLELADDKRLVVEAVQETRAMTNGGKIDWRKVDAVRVIAIINDKDERGRSESTRRR